MASFALKGPSSGGRSDVPDTFFNKDVSLTMWIPKEMAGKVIGKKGVIIKNIQTTSGAKLITTIDDPKSDLFTGIVIRASLRNALVAHKNVYDIVQETDDLVLEFPFYEKKYKFLTGEKGFNTLRKLSADTNVRIFIPHTENSMLLVDGKYSNDASFEGTYPNICKAIELIESHYKKREREPINNSLSGVNHVTMAMSNIPNNTDTAVAVAKPVQPPASTHSNNLNNGNNQDKNSKIAKVKGPSAKDPSSSSATSVRNPKEKLKNATNESIDNTKVPSQNSKNKDNIKEVQETTSEMSDGKEVSGVKEVKEIVKLERIIEIPSNIVGIFLARPKVSNTNSSKVSVLNQIQRYTHTTISLIDPPPAKIKPVVSVVNDSVGKQATPVTEPTNDTSESNKLISRRRGDNNEEVGSDGDEDDNSDGSDDDEEEEEKETTKEVDEKVEEIKSNDKDVSIDAKEKETQPVTMVRFTVSNHRGISRDSIDPLCTQESIDLACSVIARMINGERIKDVIAVFSSQIYKNKKANEGGGKSVRPKKINSQNNDSDNKKKTHNHSSKEKNSPKKDAQKETPK